MNAILFTALALAGANGNTSLYSPGSAAQVAGDDCTGDGGGGHFGHWGRGHAAHARCWGPMPQTCYDPAYGCYPGTRFMNRYPAFHGTYYRRPYNYRNVFDYPWHADLHEPTSYFSYHVPGDAGRADVEPPQPVPTPTAALPLHRRLEQATARPAERTPQGLHTLRR
jgi:hypothetical protein